MADSNGVSCKHWRSETESKTMSGLKIVMEILKPTYLDPFHLLFCLFSPSVALFLLRSVTRLSLQGGQGTGSGCWDSAGEHHSSGTRCEVLRNMSSSKGVEELK